jgi:hypothetical protein
MSSETNTFLKTTLSIVYNQTYGLECNSGNLLCDSNQQLICNKNNQCDCCCGLIWNSIDCELS